MTEVAAESIVRSSVPTAPVVAPVRSADVVRRFVSSARDARIAS
jgi:hypothetical protein